MDSVLLLDLDLNKPLTYLEKFKKTIIDDGWGFDQFWASEYIQEPKPSFDKKLNDAKFLIIRKPLTFLSSEPVRKKIQDNVLNGDKNILIMYTFSEQESLDVLNTFLRPFKINLSELSVIDKTTNQKNIKNIIFQRENNCFSHEELFKGVNRVLIPSPHYVYVTSPSKILIRGNPSTELMDIYDEEMISLSGPDIIVGAYYDASGRAIVLDSTLFLDKYFEYNKKFIRNILKYLGS